MNANGYICLLDEYFDIEYDNENEYYTISKDCMERLYKKIAQKEFEAKFFNKQYNKCVDLLKDKNNEYKKRAHTYKVEMERCRRKLTRIYKLLNYIKRATMSQVLKREVPFSEYIVIEDFIKGIKNV